MTRHRVVHGFDLLAGRPQAVRDPLLSLGGMCQGGPSVLSFDRDMLAKSMLTIGGTGSGKTNFTKQLVAGLLPALGEGGLLIADPKGDYAFACAAPGSATMGSHGSTVAYNLFKDVLHGPVSENAALVAQALFSGIDGEGSQAFFKDAAIIVTSEIIDAMAVNAKHNPAFASRLSNKQLFDFLLCASQREMIAFIRAAGVRCASSALMGEEENSQSLGVRGEIARVITSVRGDWANDAALARSAGVCDYSSGGKVLRLTHDVASTAPSPLLQAALELWLKKSLEASSFNMALLEEVGTLPKIAMLAQYLTFGRSKQCGAVLVAQSQAQFQSIYGEKEASIIAGSAQTMLCFPTNDEPTRTLLAERYGDAEYEESYVAGNGSVVSTTKTAPVIAPFHVTALQVGEAVVCPPIPAGPYRFKFKCKEAM